jgi:hypothetical protein
MWHLYGNIDSLFGGNATTLRIDQKVVTVIYGVLCFTWLLIAALSRMWMPVRLSRWEESASGYSGEIIRITFISKEYAREFAKANRQERGFRNIMRKAWYNPIHWPRIAIYIFLAYFIFLFIQDKII